MKRKRKQVTPNREDNHRLRLAERAFERIQPTIAGIPTERVEQIRLDLLSVARVARKVSKLVQQPDVRRRFEAVAAVFDVTQLDELGDLSLAVWYARTEADRARARAAEMRRMTKLILQGRELKHRMLRVLAYHFAESGVVNAELDGIRPGTGRQDLAADLSQLARLYEAHQGSLRNAGTWYRPEDAALAHGAAERILDGLDDRSEDPWPPILARLWTRLHQVYEEVRRTGEYVFRGDPMAESFPSLVTATRGKPHHGDLEEDETEELIARPEPESIALPATSETRDR